MLTTFTQENSSALLLPPACPPALPPPPIQVTRGLQPHLLFGPCTAAILALQEPSDGGNSQWHL